MTNLFWKMMAGDIKLCWLDEDKPVFYEVLNNRYIRIIGPEKKEWDEYAEAWEAYKRVPLVRALE